MRGRPRKVQASQDNVVVQGSLLNVKTYADILASDWDPTLLSRANFRYNDAVKLLVFASSWIGLSPAELQAFQAEYRRTAFICTVRNCERSRSGYPSLEKLHDHTTKQHSAGFRCSYQNCPYNDIGFTCSKSLREHEKRSHLRDLPTVPKTLKRKYPADGPSEDIRAAEPSVSVPQAPQRPPDRQPLFEAGKQRVDFGQYAFQFIQSDPYHGLSWQTSVSISERVGKSKTL